MRSTSEIWRERIEKTPGKKNGGQYISEPEEVNPGISINFFCGVNERIYVLTNVPIGRFSRSRETQEKIRGYIYNKLTSQDKVFSVPGISTVNVFDGIKYVTYLNQEDNTVVLELIPVLPSAIAEYIGKINNKGTKFNIVMTDN